MDLPRDPFGGPPDDRRPDGDRAGRAVDPDAPDLLARLGVVIPDDARALDHLAAELTGGRDGGRLPSARPGTVPWWRRAPSRSTLPGMLALSVVLVVALVATTMSFMGPVVSIRPDEPPAPAADRLLPAGTVVVNDVPTELRDLRPAALVVLPATPTADCADCPTQLAALAREARAFGVPLTVVVSPEARGDGEDLLAAAAAATPPDGAAPGPGTQDSGDEAVVATRLAVDTDGVLAAAHPATEPQVLLVHADGTVGGVLGLDDAPFGPRLSRLTSPGTTGAGDRVR